MNWIRITIISLFLFAANSLWAQDGGEKKKPADLNSIEKPTNIINPDGGDFFTDVQDSSQFARDDLDKYSADTGFYFDGAKDRVLGMEDTSSEGDGELSVVQVDEELKIGDSVWVKIASYYYIWDPRTVNPYQIDGSEIKNTPITLYDSTKGRNWIMPLRKTRKTSDFGFRHNRWHYGTDLALVTGDSIFSSFDGVVRIASWDGNGWGNYVLVRHYNGLETLYAHMSKTKAKVGDHVKAGKLIGFGGSTGRSSGPHLHFEVRYAGNPIDPAFFYNFSAKTLRHRRVNLTQANFGYLNKTRKVFYHTVTSGQTLSHISHKYNVPVKSLYSLNGINASTPLRVGRKVRIR